jgi:hypothetical protein
MSFTHRIVLPLAGIAAALSMVTIGLAAEPAPLAPAAPTTPVALPSACQLHDDASTTKTPTTTVTATSTTLVATTATPTPKVAADDDNDNDDDVEMKGDHSEAVRACIEALRAEDRHGFGEILRMIARARAERNGHEDEQDADNASTAVATVTTTATATTATATPTAGPTGEHHPGRHTPPLTHPRP